MPEPAFDTYTIFFSPLDYPGAYVVRRFMIEQGNPEPVPSTGCVIAFTLPEARQYVPPGKVMLARSPNDPPSIVETWI